MKQITMKHNNTIRSTQNVRLQISCLRLSHILAFGGQACVGIQFVCRKKQREPNIVSYKGHKVIDLTLEKT